MRSSDAYRHYPNNSSEAPTGDNNATRCYIGSNSAAATAFDANHSSDLTAPTAKACNPPEPSDQPRTTHAAAAAGGLIWVPSSRSGADSDSTSNWK